jgi:kumamolisin
MKRISRRSAYLVLAALLTIAFGGSWLMSPSWSPSNQGTTIIEGNTPRSLGDARLVGHAPGNRQIEVVIGLKDRNVPDLESLIDRQADPSSPDFHKFLSTQEVLSRFAPDKEEVDTVVAYLQKHGLQVLEIAPNHKLIHASGTVAQLEGAFNVTINDYVIDGQLFFSNDRDPSIPGNLKDAVESVIGLNSLSVYEPHHVKLPTSTVVQGAAAGSPPRNAQPIGGHSPRQLSTAYNFPNELNSSGGAVYSGKGVTIGIASAYSYLDSDVQTYWQYYGIKRTGTVSNVYVNGQSNQPNDETSLDLEQAGALAPGADIIMYLAPNSSTLNFALVYNRIVSDDKVAAFSVSWGLCEDDEYRADLQTEHAILRLAAVEGITVYPATADHGAYDCKRKKPMYSVDFPASDPYVTGVGGTSLHLNADGTRKSEQAWTGSGGGVSKIFDRPSWQFGPGVPNNQTRNVADVAFNADPWTGNSYFFKNSWDQSGGTSYGAPDWLGLTALAVEATGDRLGYFNPTLYRIGRSPEYKNVFHDVTTGNNGDGRGRGYVSRPGWDHPTGWGTPNGDALIKWLIKDLAASANPPAKPAAPPSH